MQWLQTTYSTAHLKALVIRCYWHSGDRSVSISTHNLLPLLANQWKGVTKLFWHSSHSLTMATQTFAYCTKLPLGNGACVTQIPFSPQEPYDARLISPVLTGSSCFLGMVQTQAGGFSIVDGLNCSTIFYYNASTIVLLRCVTRQLKNQQLNRNLLLPTCASVLVRVIQQQGYSTSSDQRGHRQTKKSMFPFITVLLKPLAFKWPCSWKTHIWEAEGVKLSRTRDWDLERET